MNNQDSSTIVKEWNNCPKCGWFYKQSKLETCPMCRHAWKNKVGFTQPSYESPAFD